MHNSQDIGMRYRPRESFFWLGVLSFVLPIVLACRALYEQFFRGGENAVGISTLLMALMCPAGVYLIAYRYRAYFEIADNEFIAQGVFRQKQIQWDELTNVEWKWPGTLVALRDSKQRIVVDPVRTFERNAALPFIKLLRERTRNAKHVGWPEYVHDIALPLRKRQLPREEMNEATHIWSTRKRVDRFMGCVCTAFLIGGVAVAILTKQWRFLTMPIMPLGLWVFLRASVPRSGEPVARLGKHSNSRYEPWMIRWILTNLVGISIALTLKLANDWVLVSWTTIVLVVTVVLGFKVDRERMARTRDGAANSLAEWELGESEEGPSAQ